MAAEIIIPTKEQEIWADLEIGVLIHMDMQIFEPEYDFRVQWGYQPTAEQFAPMQLDTDQWIKSAAAAGAKYAVLVAKHCSGFCLWPTAVHEYSIKGSPWKNGKGDIVGDFFNSCKKYGLKPGLYYSSSCNAYYNVDNPGTIKDISNTENVQAANVQAANVQVMQEKYNADVLLQLTELWTQYGDVFEIWFDGGCLSPKDGGPDIASLLHRLQPNAVVFQGPPEMKSLLRWVGNERAMAPDDCFATVDLTSEAFDGSDERMYGGNPYGKTWMPAESDTPNRYAHKSFAGGWFWKKDEEHAIIPADVLYDKYVRSVGRNSNLLIGMVIDDRGLFPEADAKVFAEFGGLVNQSFGTPIVELTPEELKEVNSKQEYTISLPSDATPKYLVMMEDISCGERVLGYSVNNGVMTGKCIGHKRIIELPKGTSALHLKITDRKAEPVLRGIAVY